MLVRRLLHRKELQLGYKIEVVVVPRSSLNSQLKSLTHKRTSTLSLIPIDYDRSGTYSTVNISFRFVCLMCVRFFIRPMCYLTALT